MLRLVTVMLVLIVLLAGCGTRSLPDAIPVPKAAQCPAEEMDAFIEQARGLTNEFADTLEVAMVTPRMAVAPVIQDLQKVMREAEKIVAPPCGDGTTSMMLTGMESAISGMLVWMEDPDADGLYSLGLAII